MAKTRTALDLHAYWLNWAARYDREVAKQKGAEAQRIWQEQADDARKQAEKYSLPASGEALTS